MVGVTDVQRQWLADNMLGEPPEPRPCFGTIDTAANCSGIDPSLVAKLQLEPVPGGPLKTAAGQTGNLPRYFVNFTIRDPVSNTTHTFVLRVAALRDYRALTGVDVVIGQDVLYQCHLRWDGPKRLCMVSYHE